MPATWTNTQIIDNLLRTDLKWTGQTITYGFPTAAPSWSPSGVAAGFSPFDPAQKVAARTMLGLWDDLIRPDFVESGGANADITLQNSNTNIGYAFAYFPGTWGAAGSAWFNSNYDLSSGGNDLMTPKAGAWGWMATLHEIGHTLGLDHPGDYGNNPTYATAARYAQDTTQYTVMSYFDGGGIGADWVATNGHSYNPQTPMLHDVLAIQAQYGAETTTRTGNTHYGFNSNAGNALFDFTRNAHPILTIWDAGGNDTLDLSGFRSASRIDLTAGSFSDCDGMTMNVAIAFGASIENAIGGSGNDSLTGNGLGNSLRGLDGNDTLRGGGGADRLIGGAGQDTFVLAGLADSPVIGGDVVVGFERGVDRINLAAIDAITGGGDDAFRWIGSAAFSDAAGELRFDGAGARTLVTGDVDGDGVADFQIACNGVVAFGAADFVL